MPKVKADAGKKGSMRSHVKQMAGRATVSALDRMCCVVPTAEAAVGKGVGVAHECVA